MIKLKVPVDLLGALGYKTQLFFEGVSHFPFVVSIIVSIHMAKPKMVDLSMYLIVSL